MPDPGQQRLPIITELGSDLHEAFERAERGQSRWRRLLASRVGVLLAVGLAGSATALATTQPWRSLDDAVSHGHRPPAPNATGPLLDGSGPASLSDYRGRILILSFWASWCEPCHWQAATIATANEKLTKTGAGAAILVGFKDQQQSARRFVAKKRLTLPVITDPDGAIARRYGTRAFPETFVIDAEGRVVAVSRHLITPTYLARAIRKAEQATGTLKDPGQPRP